MLGLSGFKPTRSAAVIAALLAVAALVCVVGLGIAGDPVDQLNKQILAKVPGTLML